MANNPFQQIEVRVPDSNQFDLSHDNKLSLDMGRLYPVLVMETLPGDKFRITTEAIVRMAPMLYPIMHVVNVFVHFFYVPNRILWNNWEQFIGGEDYAVPYIQGTTGMDPEPLNVEVGSLYDYLGLPVSTNITEKILAFPLIAYYRIYNEYYEDQNNDEYYTVTRDALKAVTLKNGRLAPDDFNPLATAYDQYQLGFRCWEHDYFTSALPYAQKGPAVSIPVSLNDLPVEVYEVLGLTSGVPPTIDGTLKNLVGAAYTDDGINPPEFIKMAGLADGSLASIEGNINQLRVSYALQRYYELNARSGTRYNETIKARWGVKIPDDRISRPEYIGGIKNNVVISEVLQTSSTVGGDFPSALADYAGHGSAYLSGNTIDYYCPEHGYIMGIMSVVPKTAYYQGIPRHYSRQLQTDWFTPEFAHIGEQSVLNKELYYDNALSDNNDEFGYMPQGSEYKYIPSGVHGQFQTTFLPFHLARKFDNRPNLNLQFVAVNDEKRIYAVTESGENSLYAHLYFDIKANRKIPYYSTPI